MPLTRTGVIEQVGHGGAITQLQQGDAAAWRGSVRRAPAEASRIEDQGTSESQGQLRGEPAVAAERLTVVPGRKNVLVATVNAVKGQARAASGP